MTAGLYQASLCDFCNTSFLHSRRKNIKMCFNPLSIKDVNRRHLPNLTKIHTFIETLAQEIESFVWIASVQQADCMKWLDD